ncbi:MAG TPA: hypothetical protein VG816_07245, partial [Solirubrobacterales bacterium]|nr:hypothetical protein [Solirubrobacterales bacterium]
MRGKRARRRLLPGLALLLLCVSALAAPAGAATAELGACGNEGLRLGGAGEGLADCRAYEQATPLAKEGVGAQGEAPFVRAASDGGAVTFLAGTSGTPVQEYTPSVAVRGGGAWSTEPLLTPAQMKGNSEVIGIAPDLAWVFVRAVDREPATPLTALLARSTADGTERVVVPPTAGFEPRFVAASADGSLLAFEAPQALAGVNGARPGRPNLYGWDRAGGGVRLLGALNDGSAPAEGAIGGSYDWMRGTTAATLAEGGASRDYYTQDQGVLSAAGTAVYFTAAGSGQLYLRRNPFAAQSPLDAGGSCLDAALACTVRLSAPSKTNGSGPGGTDPEGPEPAAFMGASADGGRSFFTSPEDLTDDASTGVSQVEPGIVRTRSSGGGAIEPGLVDAAANGIATDESHLYWANPSAGSIGRAHLDGSGAEAGFVSGVASPGWVAVDGEYLYWTSPATVSEGNDGTIGRVRLDGTAPPEPDFITAAGDPRGIAVDAAHLYWSNASAHAISRAAIDGSGVEPSFHFIGSTEVPEGIAVDGSHLYWATNNPNGYVSRSELDGSNEIFAFVGALDEVRGIAVDAGHVYWSTAATRRVGRANLDLEEVEREFVPEAGRGAGMAVAGSHLYWVTSGIENGSEDLYRYDAGSGELSDLTPDPSEVNGAEVLGVLGIAADGSRIYFAANGVLADEPNARGETAQPGTCSDEPDAAGGECNLYLSSGGAIRFVARLQTGGDPAQSDAANWAATPTGSFFSPTFQQTARVSTDGGTLLFRSRRQLTAYASGGTPELYLFRLGDGKVICVSCDPDGAAPAGPPTLGTIFPPTEFGRRPVAARSRILSADGRRVFFESVDPLVAADRNGESGCAPVGFPRQAFPSCQDVYEWEAAGTGSCAEAAEAGCLYLLSGARPGRPALLADASADGDEVFFFSAAPLLGQDGDELFDVYDARVEGGLAGQGTPAAGCSGEACRPPANAS